MVGWRLELPAQRLAALNPAGDMRLGLPAILGLLLLIPTFLLLMSSGSSAARLAESGFSGFAAMLGLYLLAGRGGLAIGGLLTVLLWSGVERSGLSFDLLALAAALAAGYLLAAVLRIGQREIFLLSLLVLDVLVVSLHLTSGALFPASFAQAFPDAGLPPVLSGVVCQGFFLGGIDIACAVFVGRLIRAERLSLRAALLGYLAAQLIVVSLVASGLFSAFPAIAAPVCALAVARLRRSWSSAAC